MSSWISNGASPFDATVHEATARIFGAHRAALETLEASLQHMRAENTTLRMRLAEIGQSAGAKQSGAPTVGPVAASQAADAQAATGQAAVCATGGQTAPGQVLAGQVVSSHGASGQMASGQVPTVAAAADGPAEQQCGSMAAAGAAVRPTPVVVLPCGAAEARAAKPTAAPQTEVPRAPATPPPTHICDATTRALAADRPKPRGGLPRATEPVVAIRASAADSRASGTPAANEPSASSGVVGPDVGKFAAEEAAAVTLPGLDIALRAVLQHFGLQDLPVERQDEGLWSIAGVRLLIQFDEPTTNTGTDGLPFRLLASSDGGKLWETLESLIKRSCGPTSRGGPSGGSGAAGSSQHPTSRSMSLDELANLPQQRSLGQGAEQYTTAERRDLAVPPQPVTQELVERQELPFWRPDGMPAFNNAFPTMFDARAGSSQYYSQFRVPAPREAEYERDFQPGTSDRPPPYQSGGSGYAPNYRH